MDKPSTPEEICNLALDRLGQRTITSISAPTTEIERIMARWYDPTRRLLLRRFRCNFAKKYATLEVDTDSTPPWGYASSFYLPDDNLRILSIGDITVGDELTGQDYDIAENRIYTNSDEDGDLKVQYIKDAELITEFDPLFIEVLYLKLAEKVAYKFTLKNSFVQELRIEAADAVLAMAAISGQEKPPIRRERSRIIARRRSLGGRDLTRFD